MKDLSYVRRQSSPRESLSVVCLLSPELQEVASSKVLKELIAKVKEEIFEAATLNKEYEVYE